MDITETTSIPLNARIKLLNREIEYVRFLNRTGEGDYIRAAAGVRVLELQVKLKDLMSKKGATS